MLLLTLESSTDEQDKNTQKLSLNNKTRSIIISSIYHLQTRQCRLQKKVELSMIKAAEVYQNKMKDYPAAIKLYEEYAERFPNKLSNLVSVFFNLYQTWQRQKTTK